MTRPLIQIDDEIREMTDEEFENYQNLSAHAISLDQPMSTDE
jgi:hypothetical protein